MSDQLNLEQLKEDAEALGEKVKKLKEDGADAEAIKAAVADLLAVKKRYAENNNGIGVDGKPYDEPMTKAQKKAKERVEKQKEAVDANPEADSSSKNAQKKADKKAAKKAAKQISKEGGAPSGQMQQAAASNSAQPNNNKARPAFKPPPARMSTRIQPNQIVVNPNLPLNQRPVVALTMAVLNNTLLDYDITSDHMSRHAALGLPDGGAVVGDFAIARYIVASGGDGDRSAAQDALINTWIDYAQSIIMLPTEQTHKAVAMTLEHALQDRTYLVGHSLSLADICLFAALGFPSQHKDRLSVLNAIVNPTAQRWINMVASCPAVMEATQLAMGIAYEEAIFDENDKLEPLAEGMNLLQGAVPGKVVTRFPPEPSGYLHIGHAKAVLLNDYYARRYRGRLILRFDDTNPSKEKEEYQESIIEDLAKLGVKPDLVTFTSDYFSTISKYAEYLISKGLAYMDDTPQEQMKEERMKRQDSKHRSQSPEDAMKFYKLMHSGSEEGGAWCLRAKIDMQSVNGTMRDPVIYRQNLTPHHRAGTTYKAYPTYDLACPIVDSLEGVTHALRTTEYNDRDEQYQWILKTLFLRRVRIHGFSRVNFTNTVMSKRKLTWFVDSGHVTGWDDPRFPTVRGVVRRGINIEALRQFMYLQGASRNIVNMEWSKFWAENKKEIDKTAKRFMAIDKEQNVKLIITNAPDVDSLSFITTDYHPKDSSLGHRVVRIANEVLLERVDTEGMVVDEEFVLVRWGVMKVSKVSEGSIEAVYLPDGDFKAAKRKLSWIADVSTNTPCVLTEFDNLISKDKLEEEDNFMDFINPHTMASTDVVGDAGLKMLRRNDIIQLERRGYYRVDRPYMSADKPLILFMVPDGRTKSMSGQSGKLKPTC